MGRRNKRQSNSSYEFAQRQTVALDDYEVSFVINTVIWLVSLDCLKTLMMMTSATENMIADVALHEHLPSSSIG